MFWPKLQNLTLPINSSLSMNAEPHQFSPLPLRLDVDDCPGLYVLNEQVSPYSDPDERYSRQYVQSFGVAEWALVAHLDSNAPFGAKQETVDIVTLSFQPTDHPEHMTPERVKFSIQAMKQAMRKYGPVAINDTITAVVGDQETRNHISVTLTDIPNRGLTPPWPGTPFTIDVAQAPHTQVKVLHVNPMLDPQGRPRGYPYLTNVFKSGGAITSALYETDEETLGVFRKSVAPVTVVMYSTDVPVSRRLAASCLASVINTTLNNYGAASFSAMCQVNGEERAGIMLSLDNTGGVQSP